jgi:hypothetical protein
LILKITNHSSSKQVGLKITLEGVKDMEELVDKYRTRAFDEDIKYINDKFGGKI